MMIVPGKVKRGVDKFIAHIVQQISTGKVAARSMLQCKVNARASN